MPWFVDWDSIKVCILCICINIQGFRSNNCLRQIPDAQSLCKFFSFQNETKEKTLFHSLLFDSCIVFCALVLLFLLFLPLFLSFFLSLSRSHSFSPFLTTSFTFISRSMCRIFQSVREWGECWQQTAKHELHFGNIKADINGLST